MEYIELDELKLLLERAYEEGNGGYLGMKSECVSKIVEEFHLSRKAPPHPSFTLTTSTTTTTQENVASPYYLYSTMTVPPSEIVRRDEVV